MLNESNQPRLGVWVVSASFNFGQFEAKSIQSSIVSEETKSQKKKEKHTIIDILWDSKREHINKHNGNKHILMIFWVNT